MKKRVYIETTIPSYLTAWPSRDLIIAAHQQITRDWWQNERVEYELYLSAPVLRESAGGDEEAARLRLESLAEIVELAVTEEAESLADSLRLAVPLPERAAVDALHISVATVSGMDYLLTWNCTHIANATLRSRIESVCRSQGYAAPIICTPEELRSSEDE